MVNAANLYAQKVFAEHPIAMWSLDEDAGYVSRISNANRYLDSWTVNDEGVTVNVYDSPSQYPENIEFPQLMLGSIVSKIGLSPLESGQLSKTFRLVSPTLIANEADVDVSKKSISAGMYVFSFSKALDIAIGIQYTANGIEMSDTKSLYIPEVPVSQEWAFVSETFDLPNNFSNIKMIIDVTYEGNVVETDEMLINGITFGQWSEKFNVSSLGIDLEDISLHNHSITGENISTQAMGYPALAYGFSNDYAYYLSNGQTLCAINDGFPLVFGAASSTRLIPNIDQETYEHKPSLIFPGLGFLNKGGDSKPLTLEFWARINASSTSPKRFLGPVSSLDGLYVNDSFIVLRIGNSSASYYVSEWNRPMLVSVRLSDGTASVMINGEEVITLNAISTVDFPDIHDELGNNQDWIGFYCYENDLPLIEIDAVAIYPYAVPNVVSKRRFVYGQGVELPQNIRGSDLSNNIVADYTVSKYSKNYSYPDIGKWKQGIAENLVVDNLSMSLPNYALPEVNFSNKTSAEWYEDVSGITGNFGDKITLKPNLNWDDTEGHILFNSMDILSQDAKAVYCLVETNELDTAKQCIMQFDNSITGESLAVFMQEENTTYEFSYTDLSGNHTTKTVYSDSTHLPGSLAFIGIEFDKFATANWSVISEDTSLSTINSKLLSFFGAKHNLSLSIGGTKQFGNTFSGGIYRVGLCTARNLQKIALAFTSNGIAIGYNGLDQLWSADAQGFINQNSVLLNGIEAEETTAWDETFDAGSQYFGSLNSGFNQVADAGGVNTFLVDVITEHIASYTLIPKTFIENFSLDVAVNGYWQDYVPLSYFSKYVEDGNGGQVLELDFLQFNVSYPASTRVFSEIYDTSKSIVKTFISFEYLGSGSSVDVDYVSIDNAPRYNVVTPGENWYIFDESSETYSYRKYEVVNGTVVYLPKNIDLNKASLVIHVEVLSKGISENPIRLQSIQIASQSLNFLNSNPIGTKYGADILPYTRSGVYYDYKGVNPVCIYKGSTPYLYLTSNSGFKMIGNDYSVERGISVPINRSGVQDMHYRVISMQMALLFSDEKFSTTPTKIMEIDSNDGLINIYMIADTPAGERAKLYATDAATGIHKDGVAFYVNGRLVGIPVIDRWSWSMVGLTFASPLSFDGRVGAIRFTGPITFNNVSYYQISKADLASSTIFRRWYAVTNVDGIPAVTPGPEDPDGQDENVANWKYWKDSTTGDESNPIPFIWRDVLFISADNVYNLDAGVVFKKFTGTDAVVADTDKVFRFNGYKYLVYEAISWKSNTVTPV